MFYTIKSGSENMRISDIERLLGQSYWAKGRTAEVIEKTVSNSLCMGAFLIEGGAQIAFARVVTDYTTVFYLCDVIVDAEYRGRGVGSELIGALLANSSLSGLNGVLATVDAHTFYNRFGFNTVADKYMARKANG